MSEGPVPSQEWLQGCQVGHQVWPGEGCAGGASLPRQSFGLSLPGGCLPPLGTWDCCPQLYSTLGEAGQVTQEWSSLPPPPFSLPLLPDPQVCPDPATTSIPRGGQGVISSGGIWTFSLVQMGALARELRGPDLPFPAPASSAAAGRGLTGHGRR